MLYAKPSKKYVLETTFWNGVDDFTKHLGDANTNLEAITANPEFLNNRGARFTPCTQDTGTWGCYSWNKGNLGSSPPDEWEILIHVRINYGYNPDGNGDCKAQQGLVLGLSSGGGWNDYITCGFLKWAPANPHRRFRIDKFVDNSRVRASNYTQCTALGTYGTWYWMRFEKYLDETTPYIKGKMWSGNAADEPAYGSATWNCDDDVSHVDWNWSGLANTYLGIGAYYPCQHDIDYMAFSADQMVNEYFRHNNENGLELGVVF